jgi:hypothetical protein
MLFYNLDLIFISRSTAETKWVSLLLTMVLETAILTLLLLLCILYNYIEMTY